MDDVSLDELDERLRSRILAATAHASARVIRRQEGVYSVDAWSGDRIIRMSLALRADDSVAETTETFPVQAVHVVSTSGDDLLVEIRDDTEPRFMTLPGSVVRQSDTTPETPAAFEALVGSVDYPMYIVTAAGEEASGCLVGFATQASIDPPRMLVCLSEQNRTTQVAADVDHLAVHFLSEANADMADLFGAHSSDDIDKWAQCSWRPGPHGTRLLDGTNGWVVLRITARHPVGDHIAYVGDVIDAQTDGIQPQLGFQRTRHIDAGHPA